MTTGSKSIAGRSALGAIFLTVFLDMVGFGTIIPIVPRFARRLDDNALAATALMSAYSFFQLLMAPVWGRVSDRIGRRPVLLVSIAAGIIANLLFGVVGALWALYLARSLAGAAGANISTAQAYIADVTTPADRARGMGMIGAALGMGFVLGPAIGGVAAQLGDARTPFLVAAALAGINFLYVLLALPEPKRAGERAPARRLTIAGLRTTLGRPALIRLIVLVFAMTLAFTQLEATFPLWTHDEYGYGERETSYLFVFIGVVLIIVQGAIVRRLARKIGESRLIIVGSFMMAGALALLPLGGGARGFAVLLPVLALVAAGNGLAFPSLTAAVSQTADPSSQGEVLGVSQSAASLARILGPLIGGALYQRVSIGSPYYTGGAIMLLAALLSLSLLGAAPSAPGSSAHGG